MLPFYAPCSLRRVAGRMTAGYYYCCHVVSSASKGRPVVCCLLAALHATDLSERLGLVRRQPCTHRIAAADDGGLWCQHVLRARACHTGPISTSTTRAVLQGLLSAAWQGQGTVCRASGRVGAGECGPKKREARRPDSPSLQPKQTRKSMLSSAAISNHFRSCMRERRRAMQRAAGEHARGPKQSGFGQCEYCDSTHGIQSPSAPAHGLRGTPLRLGCAHKALRRRRRRTALVPDPCACGTPRQPAALCRTPAVPIEYPAVPDPCA